MLDVHAFCVYRRRTEPEHFRHIIQRLRPQI
jgi:hypothetical protein